MLAICQAGRDAATLILVWQRDALDGMLVLLGEAHAAGERATAGGRQDARWHHLARRGRKVQAVAVCLNAGDVMLIELGDR